uniref:Uncharacterized protein n=1 Tax=Anguilla anguilla TaxID=7936 RepID=A0A0E9U3U8_ANGAN
MEFQSEASESTMQFSNFSVSPPSAAPCKQEEKKP